MQLLYLIYLFLLVYKLQDFAYTSQVFAVCFMFSRFVIIRGC